MASKSAVFLLTILATSFLISLHVADARDLSENTHTVYPGWVPFLSAIYIYYLHWQIINIYMCVCVCVCVIIYVALTCLSFKKYWWLLEYMTCMKQRRKMQTTALAWRTWNLLSVTMGVVSAATTVVGAMNAAKVQTTIRRLRCITESLQILQGVYMHVINVFMHYCFVLSVLKV